MAGTNKDVYTTFQGTQLYMSPERLRGEEHSFNSDIWSLGVTLAECAIGKFPFEVKDCCLWDIISITSEKKK